MSLNRSVMSFAEQWLRWKIIVFNELSQSQKEKYNVSSHFLCPRSYMDIWINTCMYMCKKAEEKLPRKKRRITGEKRVRKGRWGLRVEMLKIQHTHTCIKLKNKYIYFLQTFLTFKMNLFFCALWVCVCMHVFLCVHRYDIAHEWPKSNMQVSSLFSYPTCRSLNRIQIVRLPSSVTVLSHPVLSQPHWAQIFCMYMDHLKTIIQWV